MNGSGRLLEGYVGGEGHGFSGGPHCDIGGASAALGADGDFFKLGQNIAQSVSALVKRGSGPALQLEVGSNQPPLKVDSDKMVRNLNADELDSMHASQLAPRGYAQVTTSSPFTAPGTSKEVIGIQRTDAPGNVYCFNLSFTPKAVVVSANINNNATVGTAVGANNVPSACASLGTAQEYTTSAHHNDIDFGIVFM